MALPPLFPSQWTNKIVSTLWPVRAPYCVGPRKMLTFSSSVALFAVSFVSKASENQTTRSKMEQLKTIMEERKEKRKEKRFAPYEKRFSAVISADPWSAPNADAGVLAATEPMDAETIHSKAAVIA